MSMDDQKLYSVIVEVSVYAEDLTHASEIVETELFPVAGWDNPVAGITILNVSVYRP